MEAALGLLLVVAIAGSGLGAWRLTSSPRRVLSPEREAMRSALHHAIATLPHLRRGLDETSAKAAAPHLRALTQATAVAITDGDRVLALDGISGNDASASHLRDLSAHVMTAGFTYSRGRTPCGFPDRTAPRWLLPWSSKTRASAH